jgi:hypothetical protein
VQPWKIILGFLLALTLVDSLATAWSYDWNTGDEYWHFAWNERFYNTGESERLSASNFASPMPVTVLNVLAKHAAVAVGVEAPEDLRFASRLPSVAFFALFFVVLFYMARNLFGPKTAFLAVGLAALDPNLTAHGSVIAVDQIFVVATVLSLWAFTRYAKAPNYKNALLSGLALGFAFSVKYSAVLLVFLAIPAILYGLLSQLMFIHRSKKGSSNLRLSGAVILKTFLHLVAAGILTILVINTVFGWSGSFTPLNAAAFQSTAFKSLSAVLPFSPFPPAFLSGLDLVLAAERGASWNVVIAGHYFTSGIWYYFVLLWLFKTPLASIFLTTCASVLLIKNWRTWRSDHAFCYLLFSFLIFLGYFSFIFKTQVGFRYALMCVPLGLIFTAYAFTHFVSWGQLPIIWKNRLKVLGPTLLFLALGERIFFFGNPLSFSNSLILPKKNAFHWLADSNIDWFQNYQANWRQMKKDWPTAVYEPPHLVEGINFFRLNTLAGVWWNHEQHRWLRNNIEPLTHIGHTYVGFRVSAADFAAFLDEQRTYNPKPYFQELCQTPGDFDTTTLDKHNPRFCINISSTSLLTVSMLSGAGDFGFSPPGKSGCGGEKMAANASLWYVLTPGVYAFCAASEKPVELAIKVAKKA